MKRVIYVITENTPLTKNVFRMKLFGDTSDITAPGQFVNILVDGFFLRRPISVCDRAEDGFTIIYKVVGRGTAKMSTMREGQTLDVLTGLGNGYDLAPSENSPLLIGGGVGVPPLYWLAKELVSQGKNVSIILGFNTSDEIFYEDEFLRLGAKVTVTTVDGSKGVKGFVTDAMGGNYTYFYACGPEPMLKAVYKKSSTSGQLSFERRMGCGFGACMGCSCKTIAGAKRICKDGPVLTKEEILWED